eukprot:9491574-Pyramimonas_sp.AAC.1
MPDLMFGSRPWLFGSGGGARAEASGGPAQGAVLTARGVLPQGGCGPPLAHEAQRGRLLAGAPHGAPERSD